MFNPCASSKLAPKLDSVYRWNENSKHSLYEKRVREVEMASFTQLVFSATGRTGPTAITFFKRLAHLLAEKWSQPYSVVMGWLR